MFSLLLLACWYGQDSIEPAKDTSDTASGFFDTTGSPTTDTSIDTGIAVGYYAGTATVTEDAWTGSEDNVVIQYSSQAELCRVSNTTEGELSDASCVGCSFSFDVSFSDGAASGTGCGGLVDYSDDLHDGFDITYAFAQSYDYYGYTYNDVMLYYLPDYGAWIPFAYAEFTPSTGELAYSSIYYYLEYYYY